MVVTRKVPRKGGKKDEASASTSGAGEDAEQVTLFKRSNLFSVSNFLWVAFV